MTQKQAPHSTPSPEKGNTPSFVEKTDKTAKHAQQQAKPADYEQLEQEIATLKDQLLRAKADIENQRKRHDVKVKEAQDYAIVNFARELTQVMENLYRAQESIHQESIAENEVIKNIAAGVEMTNKELANIFERHGIKRLYPEGDVFDHNLHQAISQVEHESLAAGTIAHVIQAGYVIKDRLLSPAMVAVVKKPEPAQ